MNQNSCESPEKRLKEVLSKELDPMKFKNAGKVRKQTLDEKISPAFQLSINIPQKSQDEENSIMMKAEKWLQSYANQLIIVNEDDRS